MFPFPNNPGSFPPVPPPYGQPPVKPPFNPFKTPTLKSSTRLASKAGLGAVKKFNVSSLLNTSQEAINTFNSFVPIYHELKPLVENTKGITKTLKQAFVKKKGGEKTVNKKTAEVVTPEIVEPEPPAPPKKEAPRQFQEEKEPNKPFFG